MPSRGSYGPNVNLGLATPSTPGLESGADKTNLDANTAARHIAGAEHANLATLNAITAAYTAAEQAKVGRIGTGEQVQNTSGASLGGVGAGYVTLASLTLTPGIWLVTGGSSVATPSHNHREFCTCRLYNSTDAVQLDIRDVTVYNATGLGFFSIPYQFSNRVVNVPSGTKTVVMQAQHTSGEGFAVQDDIGTLSAVLIG